MADGIVFVQPLHDHDDGTTALVVLPAVESVIVPVVSGLSLRLRERLLRLQRIVDQDDVGTASGEHAAGGGGEPVALAGSDEFLHCLAMRRQAGRKDPPIPRAHHDAAAVAGELVGEVLGIADGEDLGRGVMPQTPGRKRDRGHQGFQMTRWQVDDQPPDLAFPHRGQLGGDDLEMPVHRQLGLRVELLEAARGEGGEVVPQQDLVLGRGEVLEHHFSAFENRALSCSMTFSSASLKAEVSGERRLGLPFDITDQVEEDLDRAPIRCGRAVDELGDDRLALGDLATPAIVGDDNAYRSAPHSAASSGSWRRATGRADCRTGLS